MFSKCFKRAMAVVLSLAMAATLGAGFTPGSSEKVAKAAKGNEGSSGLTHISSLDVASPDKKVEVKIWRNGSGAFYYSAYYNDYVVIQCSPFGLVTSGNDLSTGMTLDDSSIKINDEELDYDLVQGPVNHVKKEYKELVFTLKKGNAKVTMNFRVSNDGMAYRYVVDADTTRNNENVSITNEKSAFNLPDSSTMWHTDESRTYEPGRWYQKNMSSVRNDNRSYSTPLLFATGSDANNAWVLLSEASVFNKENAYCASVYQTSGGSKEIKVRWGGDLVGEQDMSKHGYQGPRNHNQITHVDFTGEFDTPWRAAIIGANANDITSSTLIYDLNPPAKGDFDWVVPGTSVWSWWSTQSDAIDYDSMFDYIDFCSAAGITYCLVDYGWEIWNDYDNKVKALVKYANERNVGLLLWFGVHKWDARHVIDLDNKNDIERWTSWCEERGVKGMKVDYIESDSQYAMKNMYWITEACARHHLVLNFHGATDPNGESRTFPNLLSIEAVQGMEYFKWSDASPVDTLITLPFTRNVIGSMEYTPALMSIPRSPATIGFMLSMCVEYESAVQTWSQSGYVYPGYNAFSLIADVPSTWDESILLDGYPMSHVVRARRSGENWYLGLMTNGRKSFNVPLTFLDEGETYHAYIYKDNSNGSAIEVVKDEVTSEDVFSIDLLQYGGCTVKFTKDDPIKWTIYDNYNFFEAERASLSGSASVNGNQAYVSGKAYVQGIGNGSNNSVTFNNVNVSEAGTYQIKVYVVSPNKRSLTIEVNGKAEANLNDVIGIAGDGGAVGSTKYINIPLKAGNNTIKLYSNGSGPSIDRIAVSKPIMDEENTEVTLSEDKFDYDGQPCVPEVTVKRNGQTLEEGKQYELFYSKNNKAGKASVYIRGINGFGGQIIKEFTIEGQEEVVDGPTPDPNNPNPTNTDKPSNPSDPKATNKPNDSNNGKKIDNPINNPGDDVPTVNRPARVKIKSLKSTAKNTAVVKFKRVSKAKGYQVVYGTRKNAKKGKKAYLSKKAKSKTLKKLQSGKKYYVKVRAYKIVDDEKVWGKFSKPKKVTVK